MRNLDKIIDSLPASRRAKVTVRTRKLVAEETALRHLRQARELTQQSMAKGRYCSRQCRDTFVAEAPKRPQQRRIATTYFEWLFVQPIETPRLMLSPVRARSR